MTDLPERFDLSSKNPSVDRLAGLRSLFPNVFREGQIDADTLRRELGDWVDTGPERFGLAWPGKAECMRVIQQPSIGTLVPIRDESIDFDTTENVIIEGENLEVLKLLQKAYYGKVALIYIDPPYNTGKEFIYPDNFREGLADYLRYSGQVDAEGFKLSANAETDGRYHSKWLSMMYPRLFLARNLLCDGGCMFVSIGDDEVHNLRLLLNEIFGEENFVAMLTVEMSTTQGMKVRAAQRGTIVKNCEFVLVYSKGPALPTVARTPLYDPVQGWPGNFTTWLYDDLTFEPLASVLSRNPQLVAEARRVMGAESVRIADLSVLYVASQVFRDFVHANLERIAASDKGMWPDDIPEPEWKDGQAHELKTADRSYIVMKSGKGTYRQFLRLSDNFRVADDYAQTYGRTVIRGDLWKAFYSDMAHVSLEGATPFENGKKPLRLIENLLRWADNRPDTLILDFFAGSGTTGEAVMRMNARDGGSRQFILVQLPEAVEDQGCSTISAITRERIRSAGIAVGESPGPGLRAADTGFRSFHLRRSNFQVWDSSAASAENLVDQLELSVEHLAASATQQSMLIELLLKAGYPLTSPVDTADFGLVSGYSVAGGALLVCLSTTLTIEAFEAMVELDPAMILVLDAGFGGSDELKVNALQTVRARNQRIGSDIVLRVI